MQNNTVEDILDSWGKIPQNDNFVENFFWGGFDEMGPGIRCLV